MGLFPLRLAYTGIGLFKLLKITSPSNPVMDIPSWMQNAFTLFENARFKCKPEVTGGRQN